MAKLLVQLETMPSARSDSRTAQAARATAVRCDAGASCCFWVGHASCLLDSPKRVSTVGIFNYIIRLCGKTYNNPAIFLFSNIVENILGAFKF